MLLLLLRGWSGTLRLVRFLLLHSRLLQDLLITAVQAVTERGILSVSIGEPVALIAMIEDYLRAWQLLNMH